ncbi:hypothetical protein E8E15_010160 [Penicillium rubens]|uniref:Pc22g03270 protein n=2 Tax=Penicillium chrysogenum species complex TaxID=254878 RepID=B6HRB6_PENRW|nr:uncharacterized protein N7525_005882 [Penicillium rubens]CAP97615.1 Pc22g03270 [Penicillium rubens Wisconsin 54-1255]KAF3029914.1 hypothetical protein E8E15_010160 [Penicillium rubens]KAJ5043485.1 hypothetical protein NUH16_000274 [Penicillium rubens]KAJ5840694.1 hypothetical protein N7525_005882 [Penicillium rubens]KAJ5868675.1 hypothetical protein N7534_003228 [Penicillium rubens]
MYLFSWLFTNPPLAMATVDEVPYRSPVPLQWELARQTEIFLEDSLWPQAYSLLFNVLASGTISSTKAVIPLPQHLAVAATMLVHPRTTTRAESEYEKEAPKAALRFLRLTNSLVGPTDATFNIAFGFTQFGSSRQGRRRAESPMLVEHDNPDTRPLNTKFSQAASVWHCAEDFWHAVGWAFNCSVLHPARWERWQIWLQFMCNVLEDDWKEREKKYQEAKQNQTDTSVLPGKPERSEREASQGAEPIKEENYTGKKPKVKTVKVTDDLGIFRESLIFRYIASNTTAGRNRRIMRAIFANGKSNLGEFKEVFKDELRIPVADQELHNTKKRAGDINLDKNDYGDYQNNSDEDFEADQSSTSVSPPAKGSNAKPRRSKRTRRGTRNAMDEATDPIKMAKNKTPSQENSNLAPLGGYTSLALRQQLLSILSSVSEKLPRHFMPLDDLYDLFVENIRDLSLPIFQQFISPSNLPHLLPEAHSTLCELLLFVLRESSAPSSDDNYLTQAKLEKCFLPYAAATPSVGNNAKVSILLEALMTLLHKNKMLSVTPSLAEAVQSGIARREQASRDRNSVEWAYLKESGFRMKFMVEHILP